MEQEDALEDGEDEEEKVQEQQEAEDDEDEEVQELDGAERVEKGKKEDTKRKAGKAQPNLVVGASKPAGQSKAALPLAAGKKRVEPPTSKKEETKKKESKKRVSEADDLAGDAALAASMAADMETGRGRRQRKVVDYNEKNMLREIDVVMSQTNTAPLAASRTRPVPSNDISLLPCAPNTSVLWRLWWW